MKRPFDVLQYRAVAMGASGLFILAGIVLFFVLGFNTGIDFGSGYSERIQIAPVGFTVSYEGEGSAVLSVSDGVIGFTRRSAAGTEEHLFDPADYPTSADVAAALSALGAETEVHSVQPSANAVSGFDILISCDAYRASKCGNGLPGMILAYSQ